MTVYPVIYCPKWFVAINYLTFRWMTRGSMRLAMLKFETKLQKCIRMGITTFKIFIWRGISSDILCTSRNHILRLRLRFTIKLNFRPYMRRYTSPNESFEYSYPLTIFSSISLTLCMLGNFACFFVACYFFLITFPIIFYWNTIREANS